MNPGLKAPFFRVYYKGIELSQEMTKMSYTYDEEGDEVCTLTTREIDRNTPDKEYFQEKAELTLIYGFINGPISKPRKIYIIDVKWEFDRELVTGTIQASEKGITLKHTSTNKIYKDKTLPEIIQDKAETHGLTAYVQVPPEEDLKIKVELREGETLDSYLIREKQAKDAAYEKKHPGSTKINLKRALDARFKDPYYRGVDSIRSKVFKAYNSGGTFDPGKQADTEIKMYNFLYDFKTHENVPQANRTDKQLTVDLGRRQKDGPYLVETRDDEIILKKRNFNQKPWKAYTYGGDNGDILSFTPESKNKAKSGNSVNMGFGGWNPANKSFFGGTTTAANLSPSLSKFVEMAKFYKMQVDRGLGRAVVGFKTLTVQPFINEPNFQGRIDNTGDYRKIPVKIPIRVSDTYKALQKALEDASPSQKEKYKDVYNALGLNPEEAYNAAENTRGNNELKKNPATAILEGDPGLETGVVLTILGVSKKYSGNYYVTKCTHTITMGAEYSMEAELHRQGHNIKVNDNYLNTEALGRTLNTQVGSSTGDNRQKTLPIKSNKK